MTQEQKPFEIKEPEEFMYLDVGGIYYRFRPDETQKYILEADAEIRRLQDGLKAFMDTNTILVKDVNSMRQQLADAPTWGDWVLGDENILSVSDGIYQVENHDGTSYCAVRTHKKYGHPVFECVYGKRQQGKDVKQVRRLNYKPQPARESTKSDVQPDVQVKDEWTPIVSKEQVEGLVPGFYILQGNHCELPAVKHNNGDWAWFYDNGFVVTVMGDHDIVRVFKSYKLIHAFEEPAREVEKKYKNFVNGKSLTAKEIADEFPNIAIGELARDLLESQSDLSTAQARIKELEGK